MYKIEFYVPEKHCEKVKNSLFLTGAGRIGQYDCCAWQTAGQGQFRALKGSRPFVGEQDQVHIEKEMKVELVCEEKYLKAALQALHDSHPYETPAYQIFKFDTFGNQF